MISLMGLVLVLGQEWQHSIAPASPSTAIYGEYNPSASLMFFATEGGGHQLNADKTWTCEILASDDNKTAVVVCKRKGK